MMKAKKYLGFFLAGAFLITGCVSEKTLPGKRIAVLDNQQGTEEDIIAPQESINTLLPTPIFISSWKQPAGISDHSSIHSSFSKSFDNKLKPVWTADIGKGIFAGHRLQTEPVIEGGTLFTLDTLHHLSAFNVLSGKRKWRKTLPIPQNERRSLAGGLAIHNGVIYVTTGYATLIAVDAADGEVIWQNNLPAPVRGGAALFNDTLFVTTINNRTIAISLIDGRQIWEHRVVSSPTRMAIALTPAVAGNVVIATYATGDVVALYRPTGRLLWQTNIANTDSSYGFEEIDDITGMPVIIGDYVLVSSFSGKLSALSLIDGRTLWDRKLVALGRISALGQHVFLLDSQKRILGLRLKDGKILWVKPLKRWVKNNQLDPVLWSTPILLGNAILSWSSEKTFIALDPQDGQEISRQVWPHQILQTPISAENSLYVLSTEGVLEAIR